jgi:hypothetical protein
MNKMTPYQIARALQRRDSVTTQNANELADAYLNLDFKYQLMKQVLMQCLNIIKTLSTDPTNMRMVKETEEILRRL